MKRIIVLTVLICVMFCKDAHTQQRGWVVAIRTRILANGGVPQNIHYRDISAIKIGNIWAYPDSESWQDNSVIYHRAYGSGPVPSGILPISIFVEGDATELGDYWAYSDYTANFNSTCNVISQHVSDPSESNSDFGQLVVVTDIYFFHQMVITSSPSACGAVNLSTTQCSISGTEDIVDGAQIVWDVSDSPTSGWKTISKATGSTSLTMTPSEFVALGLTKYGKKYFQVTDLSGTTSEVREIDVYIESPAITLTSSDPKCNNDFTGSIQVNITGSDPSVNQFSLRLFKPSVGDIIGTDYPLTAGQFTMIISGLDYGEYTAQVSNIAAGSCATSSSRILINPTKITASFVKSDYNGYGVSCNGSTNGTITMTGSGGSGGYTNYSWNTGANTSVINGLAAGNYTGSLTDSKGCAANGSVVLTEPTAVGTTLTPSDYGGYNVRCWNSPNGSITAVGNGGVGGYSYSWSTGSTTLLASGLSSGVPYTVTVSDANSCTKVSSLTLTAPTPINFTIDQIATLSCPGDANAILQATPVVSTIIGSAHYSWSSGSTAQSITNVGAGTYTVTVSDDQSCSTTKSITLDPPPAYTVSISPTSNFNGARIKCNGESNGVLGTTVRDAGNVIVSAQNYEWFKGATAIGSSATLSSIGALNEGLYKVVITYGTGCTAETQYLLSDPDPVISSISPTTNYNGLPISCYNQTNANLRATSSGGTGAHSYSWNNGATGDLLIGVGAGTYTVNISDVNGCPSISNYTLVNPAPVVASIASVSDFSGFGVSCAGSNNGSITAEGTGGTGVYSYSWSNGKTTALNNNLTAGLYTVTVSDNNGCSNSIQQNITTPTALTFSVSDKKDVSCYGGSDGYIKLLPGGGAGSFQYSKDGSTWQGGDTFNTLTQGTYTLRLRDGNGCTQNTTSTLTQPTQINISFADVVGATCSNPGGTARAVVTGGTGAYTYEWKDVLLNIVDTDAILNNATGGIYVVTVKDVNQCLMSNNVSITSVDGAKATYTATAAKCFDSSDGSALITITSGVGPFVITWPDGQNTLQGNNLKKDEYNVLITDANNCTVVKTVVVPAPDALVMNVQSAIQPTCNASCDGQLTLNASGGVGSYSYSWNNSTGPSQSDLCAGIYDVIIRDGNNCVLNTDVTLAQPDLLAVDILDFTAPGCKDGCDGSLQVEATGGNGGYVYNWIMGGSSNGLSNICPGAYTVNVTDQQGCSNEFSVVLPNAPDLPLDLGGGATVCVGQSYSLDAGDRWSSIAWGSSLGLVSTDSEITINEPGNYWVEVLNELGCVGQDTFLLQTSLDLLNASFLMSGEAYAEDTVVMIDISWPLPETINWDFPEGMQMIADQSDIILGKFTEPGTYQITLTAHLGECLGEVSKTITILEYDDSGEGGRLGYNEYVRHFSVHPNPNDGSFTVAIELAEAGAVTLSVWHSSGILLKTLHQQGSNLYNPFVDFRSLASGTYILRLDHQGGRKYIRFVVN